jgi:hypothetical protein
MIYAIFGFIIFGYAVTETQLFIEEVHKRGKLCCYRSSHRHGELKPLSPCLTRSRRTKVQKGILARPRSRMVDTRTATGGEKPRLDKRGDRR